MPFRAGFGRFCRIFVQVCRTVLQAGNGPVYRRMLQDAAMELFDRIVDKRLLVRRVYITATHVISEREAETDAPMEQLDLFSDPEAQRQEEEKLQKERRMQEAMLQIKRKYGKNTILKGMNFEEGATARERNRQVGGHRE